MSSASDTYEDLSDYEMEDSDVEILDMDEITDQDDLDLDVDEEMSSQMDNQDDEATSGAAALDDLAGLHKKKTHPFEVPYSPVTPQELVRRQNEWCASVSDMLGVSTDVARELLGQFRWHGDLLVERFMEDQDKVLKAAGISPKVLDPGLPSAGLFKPASDFMCVICCDTGHEQAFALHCGEALCRGCYGDYIKIRVMTEGDGHIRCPGATKCGLYLTMGNVKELADKATFERYMELQNQAFVELSSQLAWCPAPECDGAVECAVTQAEDLEIRVPTVECANGHRFCFGCKGADHQPCTCEITRLWLKKCEDDSETANWIAANTKDCPKCKLYIEKNGGCNHMTCRKCRHEFCWVCMGLWSEHNNNYNCSRYNEGSSLKARTEQEKSRAELDRYLHYFNRYHNHQQSLELDKETYEKVETKMRLMQESEGLSWIQSQFLGQAFSVLQQARHTLSWTYVFAFYLEQSHQTSIYEDNQKDLEMATEALSELFEKPAQDVAKSKTLLMDKCAYVAQRRIILLNDASTGLVNGTWKVRNVPSI